MNLNWVTIWFTLETQQKTASSGSRLKPNRKLLLPVHLGNPTQNCFFQFSLETQHKTASSSSPWKPNTKLLLPVHLGNPTQNCFFQFTLETQQRTASSGSRWKPNRKLLLPVHLGNPTENCFFRFTLETQQKTVSSSPWKSNRKLFPDHLSSILHGTLVGSEREKRWKGYGENKAGVLLQTSSTMHTRQKSSTMFTNYGNVERVWDEAWYVFSFFSLSLSVHLFSPLVHVDDLLLSFCFVMWTVTCRRSSLQWSKGEVCVYERGACGLVLVPFVFLWGEILSTDL